MTTQPEALRLAGALLEPVVLDKHAMQAADELRRLHAECEALRADAERYRLLCEVHGPSTELCFDGRSYRGKAEFDAAIDAARAAKEQSK